MGALFGKSKKHVSRVTEQDKAILQLKQQRDKLKQYQKRVESMLEKDRLLARKLLQDGKKERAKLILRKKKFQEQLLEKTDGQLENLQRLVHDLEFAQIEIQVLDGLRAGNEALKKVHDVISVDEVERILEETREGVEKQREIDELLSGALSADDEESVEAELEEIIKEALPDVPEAEDEELELPEVPTDEVERRKEKARAQKSVQRLQDRCD
ncbi:charged multivesicular body protein 6-A isoform X1 [Schistocerca americana]|uniref:charged multivesicular body protein 6-A isoform X1 n=1 Tax=Schistocerca americana TaxID=7009 RepID=UPI001F4F3E33|nr:charged multivesicular body protein 6-A isoform X1 [Schistocerca americana]XP_049964904.1 charged multivesicular body protein 6-A isoform X1 [Schistocerca serialis cubense]